MNRLVWLSFGAIALAALGAGPAGADFEVKGPDGRRILLKDDGRWRYIDPKSEGPSAQSQPSEAQSAAKDKPAEAGDKPKNQGEAILSLERKTEGNRICRLRLKLVNNLGFEIRSLVPEFKAYRPNGVVYDSVFRAFQFIKPGDSQTRELRFDGIACPDIARVQVTGGDRCEMGDLDKFSPVKGKCLEQVRVVESDLVRFDK
jgi:hypothetical protein